MGKAKVLKPGTRDVMWHPATKATYHVYVIEATGVAVEPVTLPAVVPSDKDGNHPWVTDSMLSKRLSGFFTYLVMSFMSLFRPVQVDLAMRDILNDQFRGWDESHGD